MNETLGQVHRLNSRTQNISSWPVVLFLISTGQPIDRKALSVDISVKLQKASKSPSPPKWTFPPLVICDKWHRSDQMSPPDPRELGWTAQTRQADKTSSQPRPMAKNKTAFALRRRRHTTRAKN